MSISAWRGAMAGFHGLLRRVDQAEIDHLNLHGGEPRGHLRQVAAQPFFQPGKLRPVRVQADAEQPGARGVKLRAFHERAL